MLACVIYFLFRSCNFSQISWFSIHIGSLYLGVFCCVYAALVALPSLNNADTHNRTTTDTRSSTPFIDIDVMKTVRDMRAARRYMVQTKAQVCTSIWSFYIIVWACKLCIFHERTQWYSIRWSTNLRNIPIHVRVHKSLLPDIDTCSLSFRVALLENFRFCLSVSWFDFSYGLVQVLLRCHIVGRQIIPWGIKEVKTCFRRGW